MKKKQTYRGYLFTSILQTILIIVIVGVLVNALILKKVNEDYMFKILKDEAYLNRYNIERQNSDFPIYHFCVQKNDDTRTFILNEFISNYYGSENENSVYTDLINKYEESGNNMGYLGNIAYYVDINDDKIMFFVADTKPWGFYANYLLIFFVLMLIISIIAAKKILKYVAKPIESLSNFSSEISKKNWSAELDEINNYVLDKLGSQLVDMKNKLQEIDMQEKVFIQSTSHDLKTPVMVIKGYAQAMLDGLHIQDEEPEKIIIQEAERLEKKIEKLIHLNTLDYKLEHVSDFTPIRVDRILRQLTHKLSHIKNIQFDIHLSAFECMGDADALLIAFENILDNQLRYAKSRIWINMSDNKIIIGNDGPPIDLEPDDLFQIYRKGEHGQHGLGLAITMKVIRTLGGSIIATNIENGVEFIIKLPIS